MKLQVIGILGCLVYATATEHSQADEPGIGIDLTMAYGTAAVTFRNGTIIDLGKIDGSAEYRLAMQELAQDALDVRQGKPSRLAREVFIHPKQLMSLFPIGPLLTKPSTLYEFVLQQVQRVILFLIPKKRTSTNFWIVAVTEMLSNLKRLIKTLQPTIKYDLIILSYPDFEAGTNHIYKDRFLIASDQARLEVLRSKITSQSALEYYGIVDCEDEITNLHCNGSSIEQISTVLTVTYNEASLGTTILNRQLGALFPDRVGENFKYGASSPLRTEDKGQYWIDQKSNQ